ncbi:dimethyladenosine transferase [Peptoanaerobacter stomatis]|uniref:Ribosomal RNA small subunit methyltransferase A n=1 Tax=Peptoanaerobacter stomatis TaxID=796937 RepID=G9XBG8_9FIRM|nr:16S rRNA (adenine(1518)-N(6)/adenine(1519)-N(6))-dimethyltransferase RsmA [Peptoanaerobacter stomatis]EHL14962.1 dimethyladenosine transferase [Peptoanaerobacter stomatis]EHL19646.1 dimethyladenosine transferase [Peptoanaerobacter stomatis]EJU23621.1 dimethyladenosine transferase [Peptoanaerobacter stomatis]NWO24384.1 16S rRNA (adenine(1518)-N(6)/adenine(1519)-N(6))-dimethyltransferase RsmA [Peptostreptococcaceae bacterium oral taxon 081]
MQTELSSAKTTKNIIQKYGFKLTKSLGQNFLINENILNEIIEAADITKDDVVLEIGTGIGTLTSKLCERAKRVVAVEIDKNLLPILNETLSAYQNIDIINKDILKTDINEELKSLGINQKVKVVANLPYYITTPIIMKILEENVNVSVMVLMLQKEVANRINAQHSTKDYGSLSIAVQYYCDTQIICKVPKNSFIPEPNVDSLVIKLTVNEKRKVEIEDEELFFKLVRGSFAKRRKTILNSLTGYEDLADKEKLEKLFEISQIDSKRRGETLTIQDFAKLTQNYKNVL